MKYLYTILAFLTVHIVIGQTTADALRYSTQYPLGTARSVGVGGSLSALGADFATLSTNPAGLAQYRSSEFVLTPSYTITGIEATLIGANNGSNTITENQFGFNNLGVVFYYQPRAGSKWTTFNLAVGYNKGNSYNQEQYYEGETQGSYTDRFLEQVNNDQISVFEGELALDAEAVYDLDEDGFFETDFSPFPNLPIYKEQRITTTGNSGEIVMSLAANYNEKLLIGATLGIPTVTFTEEKVYTERDLGSGEEGDVPFFENMSFRESVTTTGGGLNFKLGAIYRMSQSLRFGLAVHTPTRYDLEDVFTTELEYNFTVDNQILSNIAFSPEGNFTYGLRTPWRYIASAGLLVNKTGFISAEVEYLNYGGSQFDLTTDSNNTDDLAYQEELNEAIENTYQSAINIRLGGELAIRQLRLRAGAGVIGTPYQELKTADAMYSLGAGLRFERFFVDAAYRLQQTMFLYRPYLTGAAPEQEVDTEIKQQLLMLTLGFKFGR